MSSMSETQRSASEIRLVLSSTRCEITSKTFVNVDSFSSKTLLMHSVTSRVSLSE